MPRVVIELQANTQAAVAQIQAFAKAQRDTFDALRASNPIIAESQIKISKLTEITREGGQGFQGFNREARALVHGGIADMLSSIPIVGQAFAKFAHQLSGFPLLLGSVAGAGVGLLLYLQKLQEEATKTADAVGAMSTSIQARFFEMVQKVNQIRAQSQGNLAAAAEAGFKATEIAANAEKEAAIKAAEKKREGAIGLFERAQGLVNPQLLLSKESLADSDLKKARVDAEEKANNLITLAREKLKADLLTIEADLDKQLAGFQDKRVQDAAAAAEKQKQLILDLTTTVKGLGEDFADVAQGLELSTFVTKTQAAIDQLNQGIEAGLDTHGRFTAAIAELQKQMDEAIRLGYVPTIEKVKELTTATTDMAVAAEDAGEKWLKGIEGISPALDAIIAKTREAKAALGGEGGGGGTISSGSGGAAPGAGNVGSALGDSNLGGGAGTVLGDIINQAKGSGLTPFNPDFNLQLGPGQGAGTGGGGMSSGPTPAPIETVTLQTFQHGGRVRGRGAQLVVAHGGETVMPEGQGGAVAIQNVNISVSGTLIDQQRAWGVLVEQLGQSLEQRLRRR